MALYGCKHLCFQPTNGTGMFLAGMTEGNLTITNAEGELYADNILWFSDSEFASGELSVNIADLTLEQEATLFGSTYTSGTKKLEAKANDSAVSGVLGFVRNIARRDLSTGAKTNKYQAVIFKNALPTRGDESVTTKGSSLEYQVHPINFKIMADANNIWKEVTEYDSEALAIGAVNTATGVTVSY